MVFLSIASLVMSLVFAIYVFVNVFNLIRDDAPFLEATMYDCRLSRCWNYAKAYYACIGIRACLFAIVIWTGSFLFLQNLASGLQLSVRRIALFLLHNPDGLRLVVVILTEVLVVVFSILNTVFWPDKSYITIGVICKSARQPRLLARLYSLPARLSFFMAYIAFFCFVEHGLMCSGIVMAPFLYGLELKSVIVTSFVTPGNLTKAYGHTYRTSHPDGFDSRSADELDAILNTPESTDLVRLPLATSHLMESSLYPHADSPVFVLTSKS
jgi:hypothetical protein